MTQYESIALILGLVGMLLSLSSIPLSRRLRKHAARPIDEVFAVIAQGRSRGQRLRVTIFDSNGHPLISEAEVSTTEAAGALDLIKRHPTVSSSSG